MASEINGYARGSVSHIYLTSDGGMNLNTLYTMVAMLDPHVRVVNHEVVSWHQISTIALHIMFHHVLMILRN